MITFSLNQSRLRGGQRMPIALMHRVARVCSRLLGVRGSREISIAFVSGREIKKLNRTFRGKDKVTDVLSFGEGGEGEVLICYKQARKQAAMMGHSVRHEVIFLIVHGVLHLFGHDHGTKAQQKKMFTLQTRILEKLGINPMVYYDESR